LCLYLNVKTNYQLPTRQLSVTDGLNMIIILSRLYTHNSKDTYAPTHTHTHLHTYTPHTHTHTYTHARTHPHAHKRINTYTHKHVGTEK